MKSSAKLVGISALLLLPAATATAQDGALELFYAEALFEGGFHLTESVIVRRFDGLYRGDERIADPQDRSREEVIAVTGFDYGLRENLTLSALFPVIGTRLRSRGPNGRQTLESSGPGDLFLAAKYRLYRVLWKQSAFNVSMILGLELPTGITNNRDEGQLIPLNRQPGSGSWDPVAALASTLSINRLRFDAMARYQWTTEGTRGFNNSDVMTLSATGKYRFLHLKYPGATASVSAGLRYRYESGANLNGRRLANFGADQLVARFGIGSHPTPNTDLNLSGDLPLYQRYRGRQVGVELRFSLQFGFRF